MAKKNNDIPGVTLTGDITVNGPMFDIHDNTHVHISYQGKVNQESDDLEYVNLEFFDKNAALVTENEVKAAGGTSENRHGIIVKPKSELTKKAREREKKEKEEQLFIPSAGDI